MFICLCLFIYVCLLMFMFIYVYSFMFIQKELRSLRQWLLSGVSELVRNESTSEEIVKNIVEGKRKK